MSKPPPKRAPGLVDPFTLHLWRAFGLFPVRTTPQGYVFKSKLLVLYNITFFVMVLSFSFYFAATDAIHLDTSERSPTETIVTTSDYLSLYLTTGVIGFSSTYKCSLTIEILSGLKKVDAKLGQSYRHLAQRWMSTSLLVLLMILTWSRSIEQEPSRFIASDLSVIVNFSSSLVYHNLVVNIGHRFLFLNSCLEHYIKVKQTKKLFLADSALSIIVDHQHPYNMRLEKSGSLRDFSEIHWTLCELVGKCNSVMGLQLTALMLYLLVQMTIALYYIYVLFTKPKLSLGTLLRQGGYLFVCSAMLYLIVRPASAASNEANRTSLILCKHLHHGTGMTSQSIEEMKIFLQRIKHHSAKFEAYGFFELNNALVTSVVSAITMYWAILTQFQNSGPTVTCNQTISVNTGNYSVTPAH